MRARVQSPNFRQTIIPDIAWNGVRAYSTQAIGDAFGITERSKKSLHARGLKRRKEILQIQAQKHWFACVGSGEACDRPSLYESVNGRMNGNAIENAGKNPPLQRL